MRAKEDKAMTRSIRKHDIDISEVTRHRNGIAGEGFWAVRFNWTDRHGKTTGGLIAILGDEGDTKVIDPRDLNSAWRGNDSFGPVLRQIVREQYDA